MVNIESTFEGEKEQVHYCVIYDGRNGNILVTHTFIGDGSGLFGPEGKEERARITMEGAKRHHKPEHLRVLHPPVDFKFEPNVIYRVDLKSGSIILHSRHTLPEPVGRRREGKQ